MSETALNEDELLSQLLAEEGFASELQTHTIPIAPSRDNLPLSFAQQRLWILDQLEPDSLSYVIPRVFKLEGRVDVALLEHSFNNLVQRHEVLRTAFRVKPGCGSDKPVQVIAPELAFRITLHPAKGYSQAMLEKKVRALASRPFDLIQAPLMRVDLLQVSATESYLLRCIHHIISDAVSNGVFLSDFVQIYHSLSMGAPSSLPPLPIQYADYAAWQRQWCQGEVLEQQLDYWRKQLGEHHPILDLPTDRPRPSNPSHDGAGMEFRLTGELSQRVRRYAVAKGITPYVVLLAGFHLLLARYSQQDDIRVGVPVANRQRLETEGLIGFFVNTQVIRLTFSSDLTGEALIQSVQRATNQAQNAQDLPFEILVDALNPQRDTSVSPLFQVMFNYLRDDPDGSEQALKLPNLEISAVSMGEDTVAKYDLTLNLHSLAGGEGFSGAMEYSRELFDADTIRGFIDSYQVLLQSLLENPRCAVAQLPVMPKQLEQRVVNEWNDNVMNDDLTFSWLQRFEQWVEKQPAATAVACGNNSLTYAELNRQANQLADKILAELGVTHLRDGIIALINERSIHFLVQVIAIFKTGAAYLPLDPTHPEARLRGIIEKARVAAVLCESEDNIASWQSKCFDKTRLLFSASLTADPAGEGTWENPGIYPHPEQLAYVIFTSGSTGNPKGAMVTQRGMLNNILGKLPLMDLGVSDRIAQTAPQCFDISVWQLLTSVISGGQVHIFPDEISRDAHALVKAVEQQRITVMELVPSLMGVLLEEKAAPQALVSLRYFMSIGEALPASMVAQWFEQHPTIPLINAYGPAECADNVSMHVMFDHNDCSGIYAPVGRVTENNRLYVLDKALQPVPPGVVGEVYAGGVGPGRGYLQAPSLSAERFIPNPFSERGERLYRMGDLARYRRDGLLEFVGRCDFQIKLRGHRIELEEVEAALESIDAVKRAVVVMQTEGSRQNLAAYWVAKGQRRGAGVEDSELSQEISDYLKAQLRQKLPDYMVPSLYKKMSAFPLNGNGKINKKNLPPIVAQRTQLWQAPQTDTEKRLAALWSEVLNLKNSGRNLGIDDNFFDLGGDSLLAIHLMSRVRQAFHCELALTSIFQAQSVRELSKILSHGQTLSFSTIRSLNDAGDHPTLFCFHPAGGNVNCYRFLAAALTSRVHIAGIQGRELVDKKAAPGSLNALIKDYADQVVAYAPRGPYHLFGWCLGGRIALAVANYLEQQGRAVSWVGVVDYDAKFQHQRLSDTLNLFADMMDYIRGEGIDVPSRVTKDLEQKLAAMTYDEGLDYLIEFGLQQGYLNPKFTHEQLKVTFMTDQKASDLIKQGVTQQIKAPLTVWLSEEKISKRPQMRQDWAEYSAQNVNVLLMQEDHFSMLNSARLHSAVWQIINGQ